jgi:hypothetical protein
MGSIHLILLLHDFDNHLKEKNCHLVVIVHSSFTIMYVYKMSEHCGER